jgi:uncharacterized membrane-anchored protein
MRPATVDEQQHTKVPEITAWFWVTKIVMTAAGEAISDAMNQELGPAIAVPMSLRRSACSGRPQPTLFTSGWAGRTRSR